MKSDMKKAGRPISGRKPDHTANENPPAISMPADTVTNDLKLA